MVACPWEPQSLLGPETRAHATYHHPSCSSTGSSNIMAYFSLRLQKIYMCKYQLNENIQFNSFHKIVVIGKFTWQHSHRPIHPSQLGDHHQSHDLLHQDLAQTAAQEWQDWFWIFIYITTPLKEITTKSNKLLLLSLYCLPLSWQYILLVHQRGPAHPVGCQHLHRTEWPPQSGPSSPSLLHDLQHPTRDQSVKVNNLLIYF